MALFQGNVMTALARREPGPEEFALAAAKKQRLKAAENEARAAAARACWQQAHNNKEAHLACFKNRDQQIAATIAEQIKQGNAATVRDELHADDRAYATASRELEISAATGAVLQREYE